MVVRQDVDVASIGIMAALPEDMSPLQLGSIGKYKGNNFAILGRLKLAWEDGMWNEWYCLFDDGKEAWLAEAQGSFAFNTPLEQSSNPGTEQLLTTLKTTFENTGLLQKNSTALSTTTRNADQKIVASEALGQELTFENITYKIMDVKQACCVGSEGELPFPAPIGRKSVVVDLMGKGGAFFSVDISEGNIEMFVGAYVEWDDLHFDQLRSLEGW